MILLLEVSCLLQENRIKDFHSWSQATNGPTRVERKMNMAKQAIDAKRGTHFLMDPADLYLVTDKEHPLYDTRVENDISESMVASIRVKGVIEPIVVRKNGERLEVIDGRQRTKNAIEANKRLKAEGAPEILVPVILRKEDDAIAFETSVELNEIRQSDDVITKAEKAVRLEKMGRTVDDIARAFGVTTVTIKSWLALFDLAPQVRTAVKNHQISAIDAVKELSSFTREEQVEKLEKLVASAPARKRGRKAAGADSQPVKKASAVKRLRLIFRNEEAMEALSAREKTLVSWFFGEVTNGDLAAAIPRLSDHLTARKKQKRA